MVNLPDLPEDILLHIHALALSPPLPQVHPAIYHVLHTSPKSYIARYLLRLYSAHPPCEILIRAVKHPICDVAVAREMRRLWDKWRGNVDVPDDPDTGLGPKRRCISVGGSPPASTGNQSEDLNVGGRHSTRTQTHAPSPPTVGLLSCPELPRRLFRGDHLKADSPIPPLLEYLMDTYSPSPNSHKGYPLCRAVLTSNIALIEYLLRRHADPALERALPVRIATQMGRLDLVKLLVEVSALRPEPPDDRRGCQGSSPEASGPPTSPLKHSTGRSKRPVGKSSEIPPSKRPRCGDRVAIGPELVELAMKHGHEHIVRYFVHDKGVMPPLRSILKLSGGPGVDRPKALRKGSAVAKAHLRRAR